MLLITNKSAAIMLTNHYCQTKQTIEKQTFNSEDVKKNTGRIIITIIILLLIIMIIVLPKINFKGTDDHSGPDTSKGPLEVGGIVVKPALIQEIVKATGSVLANEEVALSAEQAGLIKGIYFDEGTYVPGGELLLKINDADMQAQLNNRQVQLQLATDREFRQKQLLGKEAVSQEEYDEALAALKILEAEIEYLKAQIDKTEIRAPFSGIIGLRQVSPGDFLTVGQIIANLVNVTQLKIEFAIPEKYAGKVKTGDVISFTTGSNEGDLKAEIYAIEPKIDPETRTLTIRAKYNNEENLILPGGFAHVEIILQENADALQVPTEAIIPELGGQKVYLYQNGNVVPAKVETGIRTANKIHITTGINAGDTVITSGLLQIRPGMPVNVALVNQEQTSVN